MRVGTGYDVHKLVEDRLLILGGVTIPYEKGLLGHSDADVLVHAVMDALLGAAALGDIGQHFPDSDPAYKGISSLVLLHHVKQLLEDHLYIIENIDSTIIAQKPKLAPYLPKMTENIASVLMIDSSQVNVKATTEEGLGFTGNGQGIAAQAVCCLASVQDNPGLYESYSYDVTASYESSLTSHCENGCSGSSSCSGCRKTVKE